MGSLRQRSGHPRQKVLTLCSALVEDRPAAFVASLAILVFGWRCSDKPKQRVSKAAKCERVNLC
jgi:hypothetical protein